MVEKKETSDNQTINITHTYTHKTTSAIHCNVELNYFKFELGWLYFRHNLKRFKVNIKFNI